MTRTARRMLAVAGAWAWLALLPPALATRVHGEVRTAGEAIDCTGAYRSEVADCMRDVAADVRGCLGTCRTGGAARECAMDCAGMLNEGRTDCRQQARFRRASCD